jgi:hypothetical protein
MGAVNGSCERLAGFDLRRSYQRHHAVDCHRRGCDGKDLMVAQERDEGGCGAGGWRLSKILSGS